jgi:ATP-dependent exoDNAse (exonuclease V) beta subunit
MSAAIPDQKERDRALDPRRSFIVQAPAGSGKTELLVRRYLVLLQAAKQPEEILAITFTKKAAAEMRKRVLARLDNAGDVAHRLRIQTIDSLCTSLTRQMPVLARFGGQPAILEDASELYLEAAARLLRDLNPASEALLRHLDNDVGRARALIADMLRTRDRWLRRTGAAPTRAELEATLAFERGRVLKRAGDLYPKAGVELARQYLTTKGEWTRRPATPAELQQIAGLREALFAVYRLPPESFEAPQWEALEAILALLKPAVAHLNVLFAETGHADFTEFSHAALRALGSVDDPSDLLLALDQRISHILVDEFQDTSQSQFELLAKLTAGWQPDDGRTLFLVGDPMQSIYRFREAEVGLFLEARNKGIGSVRLEALTLTANFRSQANLVAWFNASFSRILPAAEDETSGAVPYSPSSPVHPPLPGAAVAWHCFHDKADEARRVAELVKGATGKAAILVRNRAHLDEIVPALKAARVRFRAVEIEQLDERQVVEDLFALTRALSHPGDRVAVLACLRAPWCGLTLQDLSALMERHRPDELVGELLRGGAHLSADGEARVARVRAVLEAGWLARARGTLRDRVEGAWLALGGPACAQNATELEDAEVFLDELERLEQAGAVDLDALVYRMGRLYALADVEAPASAVEIMTIHKAKGLEFDTVIVPGLDRLPRAGPRPLFAWKSLPGARLLLAPINASGTDNEPAYNYVRELEREAEDIEAGRLFYVAATRAKQQLHLMGCAKTDKKDGSLREPARRSLAAKIWWQAREHFGPAPEQADEGPRMPLPDVLRRLPAGFVAAQAPDSTAWNPPPEGRAEQDIEFSWAGETARHVGTVVHRWLQRIADDGMRGWDASRVDSMKERFSSQLRHEGVSEADLQASVARVADALKATLADERGRWLLGPQKDARSELRLRTAARATYVVDRVFRDGKGALWVVDWKTSRHEGKGLEEFLDSEQARYAPQLERYGAALGAARLGLYFPALAKWREWERK